MKSSRFFLPAFFLLLLFSCRKNDEFPHSRPYEAKVFVAVEDGECIAVINATTNELINSIQLNDGSGNMMMAHNVQAAPDGKTIWATVNPMTPGSTDFLAVIDPFTEKVIARVPLGIDLHLAHVVLDDASEYAYATATDSDQVFRVNVRTKQVEQRYQLPAGHQPHGLRFSQGKLYISNLGSGSITVVHTDNGMTEEIPVNGMAVQSAVTKDGRYVFSSLYENRSIFKYDVVQQTDSTIPLPGGAQGPIQIYPTPDGKKLFICDQGVLLGRPSSDKVYVLDIAAGIVTDSITAGNAVHGVVVSNDGSKVFVTNSEDNTVSVIDGKTHAVIATIPVGVEPNGITWWCTVGGQP